MYAVGNTQPVLCFCVKASLYEICSTLCVCGFGGLDEAGSI